MINSLRQSKSRDSIFVQASYYAVLLHFKENQKIEYVMCDKTFNVGYGYLMQILPALTHIIKCMLTQQAFAFGACLMFVYCNRCVHICLICTIQFHNCYLRHHSISTTQLKFLSAHNIRQIKASLSLHYLLNDSITIKCYWHSLKFNGS